LVDSKKYGVKAKVPKFATSEEAGDFLQMLLEKGLFFRAKKMVLIKKKDKSGQELKVSKTQDVSKSPKVDKKEKKKVKIDEEEQAGGELEEKEQEEKNEQVWKQQSPHQNLCESMSNILLGGGQEEEEEGEAAFQRGPSLRRRH
jgi:translocation protein SEC62